MLRRYYGKIGRLPLEQFIGHDGELVIDDDTGRVYIMDGVTPGGHELVGGFNGNVNLGNLYVIDQTIIPVNLNSNVNIIGNLQLDHTRANSFIANIGAGFNSGFGGFRFNATNSESDVTGLVHSNQTTTLNITHASNIGMAVFPNGGVSFPNGVSANLKVNASLISNRSLASQGTENGFRFFEPNVQILLPSAIVHDGVTNQIKIVHEGGVGLAVNPNSSVVVDSGWTFADNKLTLPNNANIVYSNGVNILNSFTGNIDLEAVASNIIPATSNIYSLGSETYQWKDLWVSNSTIYISGIPLTVDTDVGLTFDGNKLVSYSGDNLTLQNFLEFPDSSIQETAYRFNAQDTAPVTTAGSLWFNSEEGRLYVSYNNTWVDANPTEIDPSALRAEENGNVELPSGISFSPISNFAPVNGTAILQTPGEYINLSASGAGGAMSIGWLADAFNPTDVAAVTFNEFPGEVRVITGTYGDTIHTWNFDNIGDVTSPGQASRPKINFWNQFGIKNTGTNKEFIFQASGDLNIEGYITGSNATGFYSTVSSDLTWANPSPMVAPNLHVDTFAKVDANGFTVNHYRLDASSNPLNLSLVFDTDGRLTLPGVVSTTDTTNSINTTTGSIVTAGGLGVAQDVHIGGTLNITDTTPSTSYDTGAVVINGGLGVNGNINLSGNINILEGNINIIEFTGSTGNFYGDIITGFNAIYAGKSGFTPLPYTVAQFSTNSNSYSQINMENTSTGKLASADFVGTGDIGDDANWFFDIGIAGSGYDPVLAAENNAPGTSVGPLDAYYYVQGNTSVPDVGGNLIIGTSQNSKVVKFIAGGVNAENVVLTLSQNSITAAQDLLATNVYADSYFYSNSTNIVDSINTAWQSNAATQADSISALQANIAAANSVISSKTSYSNANVAAYLTGTVNIGNLITTSGVFWSNGVAYSSGGGSSYSNADVASYLPTYTGNVAAGNVAVTGNINVGNITSNYRITLTNNAYIQSDTTIRPGSILLQPAATGTFPSVIIGGAGRIAAPNGSVHLILNPSDFTVQVPTKSTYSVAATSAYTGAFQAAAGGIGVGADSYFGANVNIVGNLTVSGTKAVSMPNLPAFRVYGTSSTDILAGNTVTSSQGATVDYNQGSYYNNTTGLFTAPVAGIYQAQATLRVGSNNGMNQASIQKNQNNTGGNVVAFWETDTNTGTATHFSMSGAIKLAVGDTLRLQVISGKVQFDTNDSWSVTYLG